jgi:hypothetical protein
MMSTALAAKGVMESTNDSHEKWTKVVNDFVTQQETGNLPFGLRESSSDVAQHSLSQLARRRTRTDDDALGNACHCRKLNPASK